MMCSSPKTGHKIVFTRFFNACDAHNIQKGTALLIPEMKLICFVPSASCDGRLVQLFYFY